MIASFNDDDWFMSNFYPSPILYEGKKYPTVEHAFQAAKTLNKAERAKIAAKATPGLAKKAGRELVLRLYWDEAKVAIMHQLVFMKFQGHEDIRNQLLATGSHELIEGNWWHDNIWGDCWCAKCKNIEGTNYLGQILMNVRSLFSQVVLPDDYQLTMNRLYDILPE